MIQLQISLCHANGSDRKELLFAKTIHSGLRNNELPQ